MSLDDSTRYPVYPDSIHYPGYDDSTHYPGYNDSTRYPGYNDSTRYPGYNEYHPVIQETHKFQRTEDFMSDEVGNIFRMVNIVVLCSLIGLFGIIANVINMIVFYKQGFTTTTNISFFALAISDAFSLVAMEWFDICMNPYLKTADIYFAPEEVQYLTGGWVHVCFGRITSWITVFITAERCLGITLPLKVKQIVTLRRTTTIMCSIFIVSLATLLPEYSITHWGWKFDPARNRSLFGIAYISYKDKAYGMSYLLNSISGMLSFFCVILLTMFLVTKLAQKSKWRNMATGGSDNSEAVSSRDKKTMKMIVMIASVLIVCYIPGTALSLVSAFVPEFMIGRALANSYFSFWSISFAFDTINSSVNVFLYYRMSTKYRQTFNELFYRCIKSDLHQHSATAGK